MFVDDIALKEAIENQFEKKFNEFQADPGFSIEKLNVSGIIASTCQRFRYYFGTLLDIKIPARLGTCMTNNMHKLLRKLDTAM